MSLNIIVITIIIIIVIIIAIIIILTFCGYYFNCCYCYCYYHCYCYCQLYHHSQLVVWANVLVPVFCPKHAKYSDIILLKANLHGIIVASDLSLWIYTGYRSLQDSFLQYSQMNIKLKLFSYGRVKNCMQQSFDVDRP